MVFGKYKLYRYFTSLTTYLQLRFSSSTKLAYFKSANFGDALNVVLLKLLGVKSIAHVPTEFYHKPHLMAIGSMLQVANKYTTVWGSGFISQKTGFYYAPPKKILAVRGPLSRKKLLNMKIECPEVYGDPALLMPYLYKPNVDKKYKIGILPHYTNQSDIWLQSVKNRKDTYIINVMQPDPLQTLREILSCDIILSSSLHGLIIADAYNIPAYWVKFDKQVGIDDFKFYDYFESVNRTNEKAFISKVMQLDEMLNRLHTYKIEFNPLPLLQAFPFEIPEEILKKFEKSN